MLRFDSFSRRSFGAAGFVLLAGCRNKLPKYHSRLHRVFLVVDVQGDATVRTGNNAKRETDGLHGLVDTAVNIAQAVISVKLERRLRELLPPGRVMELVADIMVARVPEIQLEHVEVNANPDTRMELQIGSYGITSSSDLEPAKYQVSFRSLLVYLPDNKQVWRYSRSLKKPISDVHVSISSNSVVGNISNAAALNDLNDRELEEILVAMVQDATNVFMDQLSYDFAQARAGS